MCVIDDIRLEQTCEACPEQYDAFLGDRQVGYLRLRHGGFSVDYPDCGGETILEAAVNGDGRFYDDEREQWLLKAKIAITNRINRGLEPTEKSQESFR